MATTALLAALPVGGAGSHLGHGPPLVNVAEFKYAPASVSVVEGDFVFWDWPGADKNHSVTADDGQAMTFDSDPGKPAAQVGHVAGDGFSVQFEKPGTYTYHCKVHAFMTGRVVVAKAPAAAPATRPRLTKVRVTVRGARLVVRFTVNEAVSVRATVRRAAGGRVLAERDFAGPPGASRRTLRLAGLRPGRYRLSLVAIDSSTGFATKPVRRVFSMAV